LNLSKVQLNRIAAFLAFTLGAMSVVAGWRAIGTTSLHALVFLVLVTAFRGTVAAESVAAMLFRLGLWLVILGLMFLAWRKNT